MNSFSQTMRITDRQRRSRSAALVGIRLAWLGLFAVIACNPALAGPWLMPGDSGLRHDIQTLADSGVIDIPMTTWPLAWGDVADAIDSATGDLTSEQYAAVARVRRAFDRAAVSHSPRLRAQAAVAGNPRKIRTFEDGPREDGEIGVAVEWTGDWAAFNLQGQWVSDPDDRREWRPDGSYIGAALGNWMFAASMADRWWGPGWQGSLILGNNARPMPSLTIERNSTKAFQTKWLNWIGPWDAAIIYSFLEHNRVIPDAHMFGLRINFKPLRSLEIGVSRTSLLCGSGQPCNGSSFFDMLTYSGTDGAFDHLAGFDMRWSAGFLGIPVAVYAQLIGEDGDFFPSDYLGQFGIETHGRIEAIGNYRFFLEWSDTACDFRFRRSIRNDSGDVPGGCAYTNTLYGTGQHFRGASFAHSFDGDASVFTLGAILNDKGDNAWVANFAIGNLNRYDARPNTVAANKTRYREAELSYRRNKVLGGQLYVGVGYDARKDTVTGISDDEVRAFAEWTIEIF